MQENVVALDVCEDIEHGREPFTRIMSTVERLGEDQSLLLTAPFEPIPLFAVMARKGFACSSSPSPEGQWKVLFYRSKESLSAPQAATGEEACGSCGQPSYRIELDLRGLEPPEPMVRILETLEKLPREAELVAKTERRPIHLYPHLEERGYRADTEENEEGGFITHIRHD